MANLWRVINADRQGSYPHYATMLNLQGIEFPMSVKQIAKFERWTAISVYVYSKEDKIE